MRKAFEKEFFKTIKKTKQNKASEKSAKAGPGDHRGSMAGTNP